MSKNEKHLSDEKIRETAKEAAKELVDLASATASALQATTSSDIGYIKQEILAIKGMLDGKYVTRESFAPVRNIAYGMTSIVLTSVITGLVFLVLKH